MNSNRWKSACYALLALGVSGMTGQAAIYKEVAGVVCVEAEHFDSRKNSEDDDHKWVLVPDEAPSTFDYQNARGGKYLQVQPDAGQNRNNPDLFPVGPTADYKVRITTTGEYRLWLRVMGFDGASDSMYHSILEARTDAGGSGPANWYRKAPSPASGDFAALNGDIGWDGSGGADLISGDAGGDPALWNITKAGVYTVRIYQREDGVACDGFVLQLSSKADPAQSIPESALDTGGVPVGLALVLTPGIDAKDAAFDKGISATFVDGTNKLVASTVVLELDGTTVSATSSKQGDVTTISYVPATLFLPKSVHSAKITYKDDLNASFTTAWSFTVRNYVLVPSALRVTPDTTKRGFLWRVHQNNDAGQGNANSRTEQQLAGEIKGSDGNPIPNLADPSAVGGADGPATAPSPISAPITFNVSAVINFSQAEGEANGAFTPDLQMPGIPGVDGSTDAIAAEIITFLDLPAGIIRMGVNSDDGFKTTIGVSSDIFDPPIVAGEFSGGRGAADTVFTFVVAESGVYPFRTIWEEGGGGANIEWFTYKPGTTTKVLVNDDANGGVKSYRAASAAEAKAYARKVLPKPNSGGALPDASVLVELVDGSTAIATSSVSLKFDGAAVSATVTKAANVTTVAYKPATPLALKSKHTVELTYIEKGVAIVRSWSFTGLNTDLIAYWDFNNASDPTRALDKVGGFVGTMQGGAVYTADAKGRSGKAGDRGVKIGTVDPVVNGNINVTGANVAFMNAGGVQNQLAVSFWQRLDEIRNSSAFWAIGEGQDRAFQAHVPWSDSTVYFDTGGGCCDGTQRINKNLSEHPTGGADPAGFLLNWRHFVFQKNGDNKQVWIDGQLFLEGVNASPLTFVFTRLTIGAQNTGVDSTHGDLDDFAVWASALTPAEIGKLFTGTAPDLLREVVVPPVITKIARNANGTLTIEWTGGGTLQAAAAVNGPWQDVTGATSPYTFTPSGAGLFGRIKR